MGSNPKWRPKSLARNAFSGHFAARTRAVRVASLMHCLMPAVPRVTLAEARILRRTRALSVPKTAGRTSLTSRRILRPLRVRVVQCSLKEI